ncbi:hypothetical protein [Alcanivorax sp. 24]|uniref:hypothetical protein n=1 Tax=Alcanivorax sp. 24 TaxID=2545266 RepID=UPI0010617593|nr:hypothetical protein [Alcanivorax sp. 24]
MQQQTNFDMPERLPFLEAVCWELRDVHNLTLEEMLNRYERGWAYRGALADLEGPEKTFVRKLAVAKAEAAYPVLEPLRKALGKFQTSEDYRRKCFDALEIRDRSMILDGIDLLAADQNLPKTKRSRSEV